MGVVRRCRKKTSRDRRNDTWLMMRLGCCVTHSSRNNRGGCDVCARGAPSHTGRHRATEEVVDNVGVIDDVEEC